MNQEYTSKNTSINKVTKVYKQYNFLNKLILDYGGGKYDTNKVYLSKFGNTTYIYDPYNRTEDENNYALKQIMVHNGADIVVCANVLNVIKEDYILEDILLNLLKYVKYNGIIYVQIYQGNGSGVGKITTKGYQRNEKVRCYYNLIKSIYCDSDIILKGNIYEIRNKYDKKSRL